MKKMLFLCLVLIYSFKLLSQSELTQTIRGKIIDSQTEMPLVGATVVIANSSPQKGTISDENGDFVLENVAIGRHSLQVSFIGYAPSLLQNLILRSGKELVLKIKLEEKVIETQEVVVKAFSEKNKALNEMAFVSARSFSVDETERFAGSLGDPSRMAANYAGVMAPGDQRNDIIIRGNSPSGLLWRVDGINVPNPNHFGALGTTGGPVCMLNNNLLTNSDFYTGAFPAEYGNALSGAFDLNIRNGNNQKYEFLGQVGFNGFEFGVEGPFSKKSKASFLANYRYSTLAVFKKIGIDLQIGGIPEYQDLSFKFNFPGKKYGKLSIFGIGGLSYIELLDSKKKDSDMSYVMAGNDTYFGSDMGAVGVSHLFYLSPENANSASIKTTLALLGTRVTTQVDTFQLPEKIPFTNYGAEHTEITYVVGTQFRKKISAKDNFSVGLNVDLYQINYSDSFYRSEYKKYIPIKDEEGKCALYQAYIQWQHKFTDFISLYGGFHSQQFSLNSYSPTLEPRASVKWNFAPKQTFSFGYGLHTQLQPKIIYFEKTEVITGNDTSFVETNRGLDFSKSHHFVVAYDYSITTNFRLKAETYYQQLFDIPVEIDESHISLINSGDNFAIFERDSLVNKGVGYNYGIELTLEKFFANNWYFLLTSSVYNSKYKASDGKWRNTAFNGNYTVNMLGGYEWKLGKHFALAFDGKVVRAGGKRYIPIDEELSVLTGETQHIIEQAYADRYDHYFRFDIRISLKEDRKRYNQEWAIDIQNVTRKENFLQEVFDSTSGEVRKEYQTGMIPMMLWRIQF